MTDVVAETVTRIFAAQARVAVAEVSPDRTPENLGLDSLGLVEIVFAIEEAFDIQVPFNANTAGAPQFDVSTVGSVVAAVRALVTARP